MRPFLLDVNILIALLYEQHTAHTTVKRWFRKSAASGWCTCPLTESGFVRIVSNPKFAESAIDMSEALAMLSEVTRLPGHRFWPLDIPLVEAVNSVSERLFGHQQVSDAYLLGLAIARGGVLVTLDRAVRNLAGEALRGHVVVLEST